MGKRKRQSKDGFFLPDNLAATVMSLLESVLPERANDAAAALKNLKADLKRTRRASDFHGIFEAAEALGIDYSEFDPAYGLTLKDTSGNAKALDPKFDRVLKKFQTSRYTQSRPVEALSRTMLDIILLDRLENLQDQDGYCHLQLDPEVDISVTANGIGTTEIIGGRMDWTLNYKTRNSGSILVVWEAKRAGLGTYGVPQLLVYMAGVLQARHDRINQTVWGMASDANTFQFAFLDDKKKFYTSESYRWSFSQSTILAYIDAILLDAAQSSPHTTPTKTGNAILQNYQRYLKTRWQFGEKSEDEAVSDPAPESIVDVFMGEKGMVLRPVGREEAETSKEAERPVKKLRDQ